MDDTTLAYLAGAMDSDGFFTIKKSTYHKRVLRDSVNASYSEKIGLKQVSPEVPNLLKETFGGSVHFAKSKHENRKPLFEYMATDIAAADACKHLLPFLRIKIQQAQTLLELREAKDGKYRQHSFWFQKENPDWANGELISMEDAEKMLKYKNVSSIYQSIRNGTIPSLSPSLRDKKEKTIPLEFMEKYVVPMYSISKKSYPSPPQLIAWKESLFRRIKNLNMLGIHGTSVNHLTGFHTPK